MRPLPPWLVLTALVVSAIVFTYGATRALTTEAELRRSTAMQSQCIGAGWEWFCSCVEPPKSYRHTEPK